MGKIDIVIYVLIALAALIGYFKGFVKQIFGLVNSLVSILIAYLLVKPVALALSHTSLTAKINDVLLNTITEKAPALNIPIDPANATSQISNGLNELGIPKFLSDIISKNINLGEAPDGTMLSDLVAQKLGYAILCIITFIVLLIVVIIVIKILEKLFSSLVEKGGLRTIDHVLGLVLSEVKLIIIVSVLMFGLSALAGLIQGVNDFIVADLKIGQDAFSIGKLIYENNPLQLIFGYIFG